MKSPRVTRLVSVERNDFLNKLGGRLFWGQSADRDRINDGGCDE
jgi:hypothetical protein